MRYEHLIGRSFLWGRRDCFSLARDLYADNFNIRIRDYARPSDWSADKLDLLRLYHEREGFEMLTNWRLKDLRPGDVLCVAINETRANHIVVYVGDNTICHHLWGRTSVAETLRDFWVKSACFVLRHPDVPDLRPELPSVDLRSLLHERAAFEAR